MEFLKKRFKEVSHIPKEEIKKMQRKYAREIIQPWKDGLINPDFVREYGIRKDFNITNSDVRHIAKKDRSLLKKIDEFKREKEKNA